MQLVYDHHSHWAHAALDVSNAYPTLGRQPTAATLMQMLAKYRLPILFDTLCFFLLMYAQPGAGLFLVMQQLVRKPITDGILQGCGEFTAGHSGMGTVTHQLSRRSSTGLCHAHTAQHLHRSAAALAI